MTMFARAIGTLTTIVGEWEDVGRVVMAIALPVTAAAMVIGIGVGFGTLFLWITEEFSSDATLVVASVITALIMIVAILLSMRPETGDPQVVRETRDKSGRPRIGDRKSR